MNKKEYQKRSENSKLKPWNSYFEDDRDERGNLSRVSSKKQNYGNKKFLLFLILIFLFVIIAIIAVSLYFSHAHINELISWINFNILFNLLL